MSPDYYSLLSKAVADVEDATARRAIYDRARNAVARLTPVENLTQQQIAIEARALEAAIGQIEEGIEAGARGGGVRRDADEADEIAEILEGPAPWRRFAAAAGVFAVVVAVAAGSAYWFLGGRNPRGAVEQPRAPVTIAADPRNRIVDDLAPGVDGGSSGAELPLAYQRQVVFYRSNVVPGSIVIDRQMRFLYLIQSDTSARRYGIGVSPECLKTGSLYRVVDKVEWPPWPHPGATGSPAGAIQPIPGGPGNPLGTRALLLNQPERVIHGTNSPHTIGHLVAVGCIRLVNEDVEDLHRRVSLEAKVIMRN